MIIGLTGTNGSGKTSVIEYLTSKGFAHYSARAFIFDEIDRRGLPRNRDSTNLVGNDLRKVHGPGYIAEQLFAQACARGGDAVIESIRTVGEAEFLKSRGALLLAVDADRCTRYDRSVARASELDRISFERFCEQEDREMQGTEKWDMNVRAVMAMADHTVLNNGTKQELDQEIEAALWS